MRYSGILIRIPPDEIDECLPALGSLPGVEVHYCHRKSGRVVAVQECRSTESQEEALQRIRSLPRVLTAELVYHFVDDHA